MKAINEAVAAGVCEEKTVERKTPQGAKVTIKMVKVVEEQEKESHDQQFREKSRAGHKMDVEEFMDTVGDMIAPDDDDESIMKRPAARASSKQVVQLALQDVDNDGDDGEKSTKSMKRPAAPTSSAVKKRPAACSSGQLTESSTVDG